MIKVYVWKWTWDLNGSRKYFGHASMHVKDVYISWWPSEESINVLGSKCTPAIKSRKFEQDVRDEKGKLPIEVSLKGLNENRIINWWNSFSPSDPFQGPPKEAWCARSINCSTVVAKCLSVGGSLKFVDQDVAIWTPGAILKYSKSLKSAIFEHSES